MNMSYCRFENTLRDLQACYLNIEDEDLSKYEEGARKELIKLCKEIVDKYGKLEGEKD